MPNPRENDKRRELSLSASCVCPDHPVGKVYRMTIERMCERMVKAGLLTNEEVDQLLADIQSPEFHAITGLHCAAWGRKPA